MYPQRQLTVLADRKVALRQSIARRRVQCAADVLRVTKPLAWLDRAQTLWERIPLLAKVAAIPLGLLAIKRVIFPQRKIKIFGSLLRWGVDIFGVMQSINATSKE